MALLFGKLPPKGAPSLKFKDYLSAAALPQVPASTDYLAAMDGNWEMLGNDTHGDCVAVTWANLRRLISTTIGTPYYASLAQVMAVYATQNPNGQDGGMDIQTLLELLLTQAGPDGVKALGFTAVDFTNPAEVKAAIAVTGGVWTGVNVTQANQQEFAAGQPWDYNPSSPVMGGHSILVGGYGTGTGVLSGDEKFITWAQETSFTDAFWQNQVDECWAVIWPEHLGSKEFLANMDVQQFAADYTAITGATFPVALPTTLGHTAADAAYWNAGKVWAKTKGLS